MDFDKSKQLIKRSLSALVVTVLSFCYKDTPTTPQSREPQTYSISGMVYYSTTPIDGLKLHLVTILWPGDIPDRITTTKGGYYRFDKITVGYGRYLQLEGVGWYAKIYAMRPEFLPLEQNTDVIKDLYVYQNLLIISPGLWEVLNTSHPKITWQANPEARRYEIEIRQPDTGTIDTGETTNTSYTIVRELAPGDYSFRVVAFDALDHIVGDTHFANYAWVEYRPFRVSY